MHLLKINIILFVLHYTTANIITKVNCDVIRGFHFIIFFWNRENGKNIISLFFCTKKCTPDMAPLKCVNVVDKFEPYTAIHIEHSFNTHFSQYHICGLASRILCIVYREVLFLLISIFHFITWRFCVVCRKKFKN